MSEQPRFLNSVREYYSRKLEEFGATARGVDWNSPESQELRFHTLLERVDFTKTKTLLDYGSGYGALYQFLKKQNIALKYYGFDTAPAMANKGRELFSGDTNAEFATELNKIPVCDFAVLSGIFNVKIDATEGEWIKYIESTLNEVNGKTSGGFSFNILTCYSDVEKRAPHLYYANPLYWFDYCKRNFSKSVALLHDYGLYEFTVSVKK